MAIGAATFVRFDAPASRRLSVTITYHIRKHERGLLFKHADFVRLLEPGAYRLWDRLAFPKRRHVETVSVLSNRFSHPFLESILADPKARESFVLVDLAQPERALVWIDGRLAALHGPGRYAYWNSPPSPFKIEVERFSIDSPRFVHARLEAVLAHADANTWIESIDVDQNHDVLLFRNGELIERLAPGKHAYWKGAGKLRVCAADRREKTADVAGQEILSSDKVTLRLNLAVTYRVADALKAVSLVSDHDQSLYREAQLALRAAVGTRTLDAILADKESVGAEVLAVLQARCAEFGLVVRSAGVKDIILPGDMKTILNQVIEAEKRAQAELIKRREETAAARSQANTARLLADNPVLARVRELELLKDVLAGTKATFVFAQGDLADQVRSLVSKPEGDS
jgi:regulator of protease activity HflC (stomatin/prohibitin superfamily)